MGWCVGRIVGVCKINDIHVDILSPKVVTLLPIVKVEGIRCWIDTQVRQRLFFCEGSRDDFTTQI